MPSGTAEPPIQPIVAGRSGLLIRLESLLGQRARLLDALNGYIDSLEEEPGTEMFMVSIDPENADIVWLYEVFRDASAHEEHRATEGFAALVATLADVLAQPPGMLRLDPLRLSVQPSLLRDDLPL